MNVSLYKQAVTSRGLKYSYYFCPAQGTKPTLLFLHGFPSTSYDWRQQVAFFQPKGYGIIVPDMLGYGGTDKPDALEAYTPSLMVKDIIDVLDAEKVDMVVSVSHDWYSTTLSWLMHPKCLSYGLKGLENQLASRELLPRARDGSRILGCWLLDTILRRRLHKDIGTDEANIWLRGASLFTYA